MAKKSAGKTGQKLMNSGIAIVGGGLGNVLSKGAVKVAPESFKKYAAPAAPIAAGLLLLFLVDDPMAEAGALGMMGAGGSMSATALGIGDAGSAAIAGMDEDLAAQAERLADEIMSEMNQ